MHDLLVELMQAEAGGKAPAVHEVHVSRDMEAGSGSKYASRRRRAVVALSIGLACCAIGMLAAIHRGGEPGSNGRAANELMAIFHAPLIELAGKDSEVFPSESAAKLAAKHIAEAAAVLGASVVRHGRTVELDSARPLLDAPGTLNLAAATEAVEKKSLTAGESITLHDVPTKVTITLPEDVTITEPMIEKVSKLVTSQSYTKSKLVTSQSYAPSKILWTYETAKSGLNNQGPDWGAIEEDWKTCDAGTQQSPIDIIPSQASGGADLAAPVWECAGKPCDTAPSDSIKIAYNGRYLELTDFSADKSPKLKTTGDELQAIRFHTPSEHAIDGAFFDMEVQLLHGASSDEIKTIVSIFFQSGGGDSTPKWMENIADVISPCHLSVMRTTCKITDVPHHLTSSVSVGAVVLNAQVQLVHHYEYMGSLTTPPCTEGVKWLVAREPQTMNQVDWTSIAALIGKNNRQLQPRNSRIVEWV